MVKTIAIHGFRSLVDVALPLGRVTIITGANGTGKTSLYRALGLLADTAEGRLISSLAAGGGLPQVLWAGPETINGAMRRGEQPVQGTHRRKAPVSLTLGFADDELGYLVDIGYPTPGQSAFTLDPVIKREVIFAAPIMRPASTLVDRKGQRVFARDRQGRSELGGSLSERESMISEVGDPLEHPEVRAVRQTVRGWRFYDSFRVDRAAPARQPQVGTWTPVLANDGSDLAPAIQTILESAFAEPFQAAVREAFEGALPQVRQVGDGSPLFELVLRQPGLLRPLSAAEFSDGTLRFLLLAAALLSPRPPRLLVLNEPETSLHPSLLPAVARLVRQASERTQVMVVSHSTALVDALGRDDEDEAAVVHHELVKVLGQTEVAGQGLLTRPAWQWGSR